MLRPLTKPRDTALPNDDDDIIRANTNLIGTMLLYQPMLNKRLTYRDDNI